MALLLVSAGIIWKNDQVLITKRLVSAPYPGMWEFPGGKVEPGEYPRDAIKRELLEELAIHVTVARVYDVVYYRYPEREVLLIAFECVWSEGELRELEVADHRWVSVDQLSGYEILPADDQLVRLLQQETR
jgi:8-oxo-dGTP diphosphatase